MALIAEIRALARCSQIKVSFRAAVLYDPLLLYLHFFILDTEDPRVLV